MTNYSMKDNIHNKTIRTYQKFSVSMALIATFAIFVIGSTVVQQAYADVSAGAQAARNDFPSGNRDDSCNSHGYNSIQDPGFCLSFKIDYDAQWVILGLAQ